MSPQDMEAPEKKRSPQAWKLRLPWEQQKQAEMQKSAFIQNQENARASTSSVSTLARAFMISRKRLRLDPDKKLHFLCKLVDEVNICSFPVEPQLYGFLAFNSCPILSFTHFSSKWIGLLGDNILTESTFHRLGRFVQEFSG